MMDVMTLRNELLSRFGLDINEAQITYSSHNFACIFPQDVIIRVHSGEEDRFAETELNFMRDAAKECPTVCGPLYSENENLIERFVHDGTPIAATKFVKAQGAPVKAMAINEEHAERIGEVLGAIHAAGLRGSYEAPDMMEKTEACLTELQTGKLNAYIPEEVREKILGIIEELRALPEKPGVNFGMLHGDLTNYNYFVDEKGQCWVYDFGDCHRGFYIYDVATLLLAWLMIQGVNAGQSSVKDTAENLISALRNGYERKMVLPEEEWEKLGLFMRYRAAQMCMRMAYNLNHPGNLVARNEGAQKGLHDLFELLESDSIWTALQQRKNKQAQMIQLAIKMLREGPNKDDPAEMALWETINSPSYKPFVMGILKSAGIEA